MPSILYLHGFASSPDSRKIAKLRALLEPRIVLNTPDLNVPSFEKLDFDAMVERAVGVGKGSVAVVGSSLGGLIALEVVRRGIVAPLVLIAPALGIAGRWLEEIPGGDPILVDHHGRGERLPIHRAFFERMSRVTVDRAAPPVPVTVITGRKDESVPFDDVQRVWKSWQSSGELLEGSRFIEIAEGDHGLLEFVELIAREIQRAVVRTSAILSKNP